MAEKRLGWLDEEAAEHLLRGESVLPSSGSAQDQADADRLAAFLAVLAATGRPQRPDGAPQPGQDAALAAYREARIGQTGRHRTGNALFTLTRKLRPVRAAVSVALLACTAGGVAVASTAGGLSPFTDDAPPSASSSPEPGGSGPSADGTTPGSDASSAGAGDGLMNGGRDGDGGGADGKRDGGKDGADSAGRPSAAQLMEDCRAYTAAQEAGGKPDGATMNRLVKAAGGSSKVRAYCAERLGTAQSDDAGDGQPDGESSTQDPGVAPSTDADDPSDTGSSAETGSPAPAAPAASTSVRSTQGEEPAATVGETPAPTPTTD